jgi:hypothetical protein
LNPVPAHHPGNLLIIDRQAIIVGDELEAGHRARLYCVVGRW